MVLNTIRQGVARGKNISDALAAWVPSQEVALIKAGEKAGRIGDALRECSRIILAKQEIKSAVLSGISYPALIAVVFIVLLYQVSVQLVPQIVRIRPEEQLTGSAWILTQISHFVVNWGLWALLGLVVFAIWVGWSMPNMNQSRMRIWLDRIPPWSIYRALHGSTFLLNISVMLKAGVRLQDVLIIMARNGSPYIRSRVGAVLEGINSGRNLGDALMKTGYEFPERRMIQILRSISTQEGFDEHLTKFGERWLKKSVEQVQAGFKVFFHVALLMSGALMILMLFAIYSLNTMAQSSLGM
jgi:type II secretory pathway component PulF